MIPHYTGINPPKGRVSVPSSSQESQELGSDSESSDATVPTNTNEQEIMELDSPQASVPITTNQPDAPSSREDSEEDYSVATVVIDDYQMIDGKIVALRAGSNPLNRFGARDMLFDIKPSVQGSHKQIFMVSNYFVSSLAKSL
jgi:hypothetical protein